LLQVTDKEGRFGGFADTAFEGLKGITCDLASVASTFGREYWILLGMPGMSKREKPAHERGYVRGTPDVAASLLTSLQVTGRAEKGTTFPVL
jgi:hypothetical protein